MEAHLFLVLLGLTCTSGISVIGDESICQIDKDFKILQKIVSLESRVSILEDKKPSCPNEWVSFNNECFFFEDELKMTHPRAKEYCASIGAHLAIINASDKNIFIRKFTGKLFKETVGFWFGAEDLDKDGIWLWGASGIKVRDGFSSWLPTEGDNNKARAENCGCLLRSEWHDCDCTGKKQFICEKKMEI